MVGMDSQGRQHGGKTPSVVGRLGSSLFFLLLLAMGSLFEWLIVQEFGEVLSRRSWEKTPCQVVSSEIREQSNDEVPFVFTVNYRYEHAGHSYTGSMYKRNYSGSHEYSQARALVRKYSAGTDLFCYVNPDNPGEAVLRRDSLASGLVILMPTLFVLIGAGGIYFLWRRPRPKAQEPSAVPKSSTSKSKYALVGVLGICALAGGLLFYPLGIKPVARTIAAASWVATPCKVLRAEVRQHDNDERITFSVYILYQYEFNGQTYKCDRYAFVADSSGIYQSEDRIVKQYRAAVNPVCYVNPDDPSDAALTRGFHPKLLRGLFPLALLLIGVGGLVGVFRGTITAGSATRKTWITWRMTRTRTTWVYDHEGERQSVCGGTNSNDPLPPAQYDLRPNSRPPARVELSSSDYRSRRFRQDHASRRPARDAPAKGAPSQPHLRKRHLAF